MFQKFIRTLIGLVCVPIAIGTGKAFVLMVSDIGIFSGMLRVLERGVLFYLLFHVFIARPVYLYVLGHELVHVLATWLCGGKVVSFNVTPRGGDVVTSKTNFFIELSPYFVPLYTIMLAPIFITMKHMGKGGMFLSTIFLFLVGVTITFHFVMTSEALRLQQPDIVKSGLIFSLVLIFVANLIIVVAVFSPFFGQISFIEFIKSSYYESQEVYSLVYRKTTTIISSLQSAF